MDALESISNDRTAGKYRDIAFFHQRRMALNYDIGVQFAALPPKRLGNSISGLFRSDPQQHRLLTIAERRNETLETTLSTALRPRSQINTTVDNFNTIYFSGLLGLHYDTRIIDNESITRMRRYYGVESAGSFSRNFGYYFLYRKGHFVGDSDFIREYPFITWIDYDFYQDDGRYYWIDLTTELNYKNPYLNIAMGYGSFDIGRSLSSSIILNSDVTPYGYLRFYRDFGPLTYNSITSQLLPNRQTEPTLSFPKGMAIQSLTLRTQNFLLGVGNSIIHGNRDFDLAYSTPITFFIVPNLKNNGVDNWLGFAFTEYRPANGLTLYGNFLIDDVSKSRFTSDIWMSYLAFQGGVLTQFRSTPIEIGGEVTAVGPTTYAHKSIKNDFTQTNDYRHDSMLLGHRHGSNFLSFSGRVRYHFQRASLTLFYENVQQGRIADHPDNYGSGEQPFLAGGITRREYYTTTFDIRLIPELHLFTRWEYNVLQNNDLHSIFTGIEFKY
jgi:hypothetical protein